MTAAAWDDFDPPDTYDPDSYTRNGGKCCQCTGCQIARTIHYYPKGSA